MRSYFEKKFSVSARGGACTHVPPRLLRTDEDDGECPSSVLRVDSMRSDWDVLNSFRSRTYVISQRAAVVVVVTSTICRSVVVGALLPLGRRRCIISTGRRVWVIVPRPRRQRANASPCLPPSSSPPPGV